MEKVKGWYIWIGLATTLMTTFMKASVVELTSSSKTDRENWGKRGRKYLNSNLYIEKRGLTTLFA